jgi:hypothetical protein
MTSGLKKEVFPRTQNPYASGNVSLASSAVGAVLSVIALMMRYPLTVQIQMGIRNVENV